MTTQNLQPPKNATDLEVNLRTLSSSDTQTRAYLLKIDPPQLPKIFSSDIQTSLLSQLLNIFEVADKTWVSDNKDFIKDFCHHLTLCNGFDMAASMLDDQERVAVRLLLGQLEAPWIAQKFEE